MTEAPFSLAFGESIFAKVTAVNFYGEGLESDSANGAIVLLVPSAPVNLVDNPAVTTAYIVGFTWEDGWSTGGSPIIDYTIWWDQSTGNYVVL